MNKFEDFNASILTKQGTLIKKYEYLIKYLKENPTMNVYMCDANYQSGTIVYSSSDLITRNHEVKAGDLVIFKNSYLSIIDTIGESNFTISYGFSFKGNQGEIGPQGVSISNAKINSNSHLIITLSNSQTIDAGVIDCVEGIKNKDIQVEGITSKGIANTGGFANIGDVVISGNLNVQGEEKGIITCKEVKEEGDTELIDLSSYISSDFQKSNTLYAKALVKHGMLHIVISGKFVAKNLTAANYDLTDNIVPALPSSLLSKIYREDGSTVNGAIITANSFRIAMNVGARMSSSVQSNQLYGLYSYEANALKVQARPFPSIAEDTEVYIDARFALTI